MVAACMDCPCLGRVRQTIFFSHYTKHINIPEAKIIRQWQRCWFDLWEIRKTLPWLVMTFLPSSTGSTQTKWIQLLKHFASDTLIMISEHCITTPTESLPSWRCDAKTLAFEWIPVSLPLFARKFLSHFWSIRCTDLTSHRTTRQHGRIVEHIFLRKMGFEVVWANLGITIAHLGVLQRLHYCLTSPDVPQCDQEVH